MESKELTPKFQMDEEFWYPYRVYLTCPKCGNRSNEWKFAPRKDSVRSIHIYSLSISYNSEFEYDEDEVDNGYDERYIYKTELEAQVRCDNLNRGFQ